MPVKKSLRRKSRKTRTRKGGAAASPEQPKMSLAEAKAKMEMSKIGKTPQQQAGIDNQIKMLTFFSNVGVVKEGAPGSAAPGSAATNTSIISSLPKLNISELQKNVGSLFSSIGNVISKVTQNIGASVKSIVPAK